MTTRTGKIRFLAAGVGGRVSGPPPGPTYITTAVPVIPPNTPAPAGWPWTADQFSVVIILGAPLVDGWVEASIHELISGAPGSEVLDSAPELVILEGPREVARMLLNPCTETADE